MESMYIIWLIIGLALIFAEVALGFTIILFFLGISSLLVGSVISLGLISEGNYIDQLTIAITLGILMLTFAWKPLKALKEKHNAQTQGFTNIVGQQATVIEEPLKPGIVGKVKWSGATFKAKPSLVNQEKQIPPGSNVLIVAIQRNILIVEALSNG